MTRDKKQRYDHPSYGMISFARLGGGAGRLFGSELDNHHSIIRLTIREGFSKHDLGSDYYGAAGRKTIVVADFSAAQFVALITTMNIGDGVPGTLRSRIDVKGPIEDPPDIGSELDRAQQYTDDSMANTRERAERAQELCHEIFNNKRRGKHKPTPEQGHEAFELLHKLSQEITDNMAFYVRQMTEAVDKKVVHAKAEIDASVTLMLQRLGLKKLDELRTLGEGDGVVAKQITGGE